MGLGHITVLFLVWSSSAAEKILGTAPPGTACAASELENGAQAARLPVPSRAEFDWDDLAAVQLQSYRKSAVKQLQAGFSGNIPRGVSPTQIDSGKVSGPTATLSAENAETLISEDPLASLRPGLVQGAFDPMWSEVAAARRAVAAASAAVAPAGLGSSDSHGMERAAPSLQLVSAGERVESAVQEVAKLRLQNTHLIRELEYLKQLHHPAFGPGLVGMWHNSKAACIAAVAILGSFTLFFLLAFCYFHLVVRGGRRRAAVPCPVDSEATVPGFSQPQRLAAMKATAMHAQEPQQDADPSRDEGWFEAQCPRLCLPFRVLRLTMSVPGQLASLLCSLSPETAMGFLLALLIWCGGLYGLWHRGYIQPVLGTMLVYLYFVSFFIILILLLVAALWARFHGKINASLDLVGRMHSLQERAMGQHLARTPLAQDEEG